MKAKTTRRIVLAACALCALAAVGVVAARSAQDIPAGTGYSAWELCTRGMQSGLDYKKVEQTFLAPKMRQLEDIWAIDYRRGDRVEVRTRLPGLANARTAMFRSGLGCTLIPPDTSVAAVKAQPIHVAPPSPAVARPWPDGEGLAESPRIDATRSALIARHAEAIFAEPSSDPVKARNTLALLVAEGGHLIYERYAPNVRREQPQLGWSMTKTLTALIAGLMAGDGKLSLDAPVGLPQWAGTKKASIRWRHLLNMAPGLKWFEGYGGRSDATEMLFSHADQGTWAAERPLSSAPGSVFNYSTGFSNIAMLAMRQRVGGSAQAIYDYYQGRLFAPLGIRGGVIEPDASGTPVGGARGVLRPIDWLRLGQLVANGGTWNGAALIPPEYMAFMVAASPASSDYGGFIWRQPSPHIAADLRGRLPSDLVFFAGHMGQFMAVVPSRNLVVLRMGVAYDENASMYPVFALAADLVSSGP